MQSLMKILLGAGVSAASMYYLDPSRGQDRRADARARLEYGRNAVAEGVNKASSGFDSAARQARDAGSKLGRETGRLSHGARNLAAGAVGTAASFLNRSQSHGTTRAALKHAPRGKFLIPGWAITAGVGAAAMYFFSPSQGEARRARLYERLDGWRDGAQEKMSAIGRKLPGKEDIRDEARDTAEEMQDAMTGNGSADRLRKQDSLQERPLQG
jgi:gas vesicle protein